MKEGWEKGRKGEGRKGEGRMKEGRVKGGEGLPFRPRKYVVLGFTSKGGTIEPQRYWGVRPHAHSIIFQ